MDRTKMDRTKVVFGSLVVFLAGAVPAGAFGQAAAEAGLVHGLSSVSTASAVSGLSGATSRALEGHKAAGGKVSRPATTAVAHKTQPANTRVSAAGTKSAPGGAATAPDHGANGASSRGGIAHVWPPDALSQAPAEPK